MPGCCDHSFGSMLLEMTEGSKSQVSRELKSSCDCFLFVLCCQKGPCGTFDPPCHHGKEIKRELLILEMVLVCFNPPQIIKWSHPAAQGLPGTQKNLPHPSPEGSFSTCNTDFQKKSCQGQVRPHFPPQPGSGSKSSLCGRGHRTESHRPRPSPPCKA